MLCSVVGTCWPVFWDSQSHLQGSSSQFFLDCWSLKGGTDRPSQNVDKQQTINATYHYRWPKTSTTPWQKPEILQGLAACKIACPAIHTVLLSPLNGMEWNYDSWKEKCMFFDTILHSKCYLWAGTVNSIEQQMTWMLGMQVQNSTII